QGQPEPIVSEMVGLIAPEIRQPNQDDPARAQQPPNLLQDCAGIGQMLERIPKGDDVELSRRQSGGDELSIQNSIRSQRVRRFPIRERHGLDSVSIPSLRIKGAQEKPEPASDVQDTSFAAEATEKTGAVALIAADPVRICGLDSAPIFLRVIRLELSRRELRRSEEHTSELQSRGHLVCRLLLEKKK